MDKTGYTDEFLAFWRLYPRQLRNRIWIRPEKRKAFEVWQEMSNEDKRWAMYSVTKYKKVCSDGQYVCHAPTWLNQQRYEDWDLPNEGAHLPAELTDICQPNNTELDTNTERTRNLRLLKKCQIRWKKEAQSQG